MRGAYATHTAQHHRIRIEQLRSQSLPVREGSRPPRILSVWLLLVLYISFDNFQRCSAAAHNAVAWRPEVAAPQGRSDFLPVLLMDSSAAVGLQTHDELAELDFRRVGHEEMRMVLVGLELLKFALEVFADLPERVAQQFRHPWGHHLAAVFGDEDNMGMQFIDHMPTGMPIMCDFSHSTIIGHVIE